LVKGKLVDKNGTSMVFLRNKWMRNKYQTNTEKKKLAVEPLLIAVSLRNDVAYSLVGGIPIHR